MGFRGSSTSGFLGVAGGGFGAVGFRRIEGFGGLRVRVCRIIRDGLALKSGLTDLQSFVLWAFISSTSDEPRWHLRCFLLAPAICRPVLGRTVSQDLNPKPPGPESKVLSPTPTQTSQHADLISPLQTLVKKPCSAVINPNGDFNPERSPRP